MSIKYHDVNVGVTLGDSGGGGGDYHLMFDVLLNEASITGTGTKALSASVSNYDAILVEAIVGDRKTYFIPVSDLPNHTFDVSWNATDSTSWYVICCVSFSGGTMTVSRLGMSGFGGFWIKVYGVKVGQVTA